MDNIYQKFTLNFKNTIGEAQKLSLKLEEKQIEPEFILYVLLTQKGSLVNFLLGKNKFKPIYLRNKILEEKLNETPLAGNNVMLSKKSKIIIRQTVLIARLHQHKYVGTEHLFMALIKSDYPEITKFLALNQLNKKKIEEQIKTILKISSKFSDLLENFNLQAPPQSSNNPKQKKAFKNLTLSAFSTDLTDEKIQETIDPVIGRDDEIDRLIQILSRRTKNNPLLLGEPGTGKTAIVEGLAKKILNREVPEILQDKKIFRLDLGLLVAGTMFRGEFENRFKEILAEIRTNPQIILFIDELHTIIGAGSTTGSLDAANILKPALARGEIRCIGATTFDDYKKYIERDAALERRFQTIKLDEPGITKTLEILKGLKKYYENYHHVIITDQALKAAVRLAERYLTDKFFPDKAIDLIDEAASSVKVKIKVKKNIIKIKGLEEQLEQITERKDQAIYKENFQQAIELKNDEEKIKSEIGQLKETEQKKSNKTYKKVTEKEIARIISIATKIPSDKLILDEKEKILNLEKILSARVFGQEEAISQVVSHLKRSFVGIRSPQRPIGSFVFAGPSGVGKTELAKTIAEQFIQEKTKDNLAQTNWQKNSSLVKIDMSEFTESFNISRLIGAPAGYVGYDEGGRLTEAVKRNPYCVILFDEIEKAHPKIFNLLLQILEEGVLTDAAGRKINFKNTIVIMTTNLGLNNWTNSPSIGFTESNHKEQRKDLENKIKKELKKFFLPELINRIDKTIVFNSLNLPHLEKIVELQIKELNERLISQNIEAQIKLDKEITKHLARLSFSPEKGARNVRKIIEEQIEDKLANLLLQGSADDKKRIIKIKKIVQHLELEFAS